MIDLLMVFYCVCCVTFIAVGVTSVVYMIQDMTMVSRTDEPIDDDENVTDDA